jgi:hypothetical protein
LPLFSRFLLAVVCLAALAAAQEPRQLISQPKPGEVRSYRFDQHVRIGGEVEPRFAEVPGLIAPKRSYRIAGQMVVTYAPPDAATANIQLKDVSILSSDSAESHQSVGRLFREISARPFGMRWGGPAGVQFSGLKTQRDDKLDEASLQMLQMMIVLALDPNVSKRPVKPGDRWVESSEDDQPGDSGTHNWYQKDVTVAGRRCALLLVENREVEPAEPFELDAEASAAGLQGTARASVTMVGAGLFDHDTNRVALVKSAVRTETVVGLISADRDAEVRVPIRIMATRIDVDTTTQLEAPDVPNWSKELDAQAAAIAPKPGMVMASAAPAAPAATAKVAEPDAQPAGESLGDIARRAREAKQNKRPQ